MDIPFLNRNPLRPSASMTAGRRAIDRARDRKAAAEAAMRILAARYAVPFASVTPNEVEKAEFEIEIAAASLAEARRQYGEARELFEPKWLDRCAPINDRLKIDLQRIADDLESAIVDAAAYDDFATAHGLPITRVIAQARRLGALVNELRENSR